MAVGLRAIIDMPNPLVYIPSTGELTQLVNREALDVRLKSADETARKMNISPEEFYYCVNIGTTTDPRQVEEAYDLVSKSRKRNGRVKLAKVFFCQSTGAMGLLEFDFQKGIWVIAKKKEFEGPITGHFEAEDKYTGEFDPKNPISHSLRQNPEAELVQVERQMGNAYDAGYEGIVVIAHTSNPDTIDYAMKIQSKMPFEVIIEMTAHHSLLNMDDYEEHKNGVKMNPPLRTKEMQERNLEHMLRGNVDVFGSDHAPHDPAKKLDPENPSPPSGIPGINAVPLLIATLRKHGISEKLLENLFFNNANRIFFNGQLKPRMVEVQYNPELWEAYGYNPFSRIERELGVS